MNDEQSAFRLFHLLHLFRFDDIMRYGFEGIIHEHRSRRSGIAH